MPILTKTGGALLVAGCLLAARAVNADTNLWVGGGADMNWSTAGNWTNGVPTAATDTYFAQDGGASDPTTINNLVSDDLTVQSLRYLLDTNALVYHNTQIADGKTLAVDNPTGTTNVFLVAAETTMPSGKIPTTTISGLGGTLSVNAPLGPVIVRNGGLGMYGGSAKLDLSGLGTFKVTAKQMLLAGDGTNGDLDGKGNRYKDRAACYVVLAQTNEVKLLATSSTGQGLIFANGIGNNAGGSTLKLGLTNAIFADTGMLLGGPKSGTSVVGFNTPDSSAYFRDTAGTGPQSYWGIGDPWAGYGQGGMSCTADFSDGTIDAWVTQVVVGRSYREAARIGASSGTLKLGKGQLVAGSMLVGYDYVDYCAAINGSVQIGGTASLVVSNSLQLGRFLKTTATNGYSSAKLEINDSGSVMVLGGLVSSFTSGDNFDSRLSVNSGSLYVRGAMGPFLEFAVNQGSLTMDFGSSPNPTSPVCNVTNLTTGAPSTLTVKGVGLTAGQFALVKYGTLAGAGADDFTTVMLPTHIQDFISNNTANSSIDLVITNVLITTWAGNVNDNWDINTTANWKDNAGAAVKYQQTSVPGDLVLFNDTATGSGTINLTTDALAPTGVNVDNSTKAYSFAGSGRLTGLAGLAKKGSGTLTIANAGVNDFTGPVTVNGGVLRLSGDANRLPITSAVTLDNTAGVTLDLNNTDQTIASLTGGGSSGGSVTLGSGALAVTAGGSYAGAISGTGRLVAGGGTLALTGANLYEGGTSITNGTVVLQNTAGSGLGSGDVSVEGTGLLRLGAGSTSGSVAGAISLSGHAYTGTYGLDLNRSDDFIFANYVTGNGQLFKNNGNPLQNTVTIATANDFTGMTTISAGALRIAHDNALGSPTTPGRNWSLYVNNGNTARLELSNNVTVAETILLASRTGTQVGIPEILSVSGSNVLTGNITLTTGGTIYNFQAAAGSTLVFAGSFVPYSSWTSGNVYYELGGAGDGVILGGLPNGYNLTGLTNSLYKDGTGTWTLWGTNTYIGATVVTNGTLVVNGVIAGAGKMGNSPSGTIYKDVNVLPLGTLRGIGQITAPVTVAGTLAPGTPTASGSLAISNALTLQAGSTSAFRVGPTGSDQVVGMTSVTYAGTLTVTLLPGQLLGGEVFKLFAANAYSGSFAVVNFPTIDPALTWDTTKLAVDGTLRVNGSVAPQTIGVAMSALAADGNFQMNGTSSLGNGTYRILATTNLLDPASWIQVGNGAFASGIFSFKDVGSTNYPRRFYRVVAP